MRRVEDERLGHAEVTQILAAAGADGEVAVEHLQHRARPHPPDWTPDTARSRGEIAVAAIEHGDAVAPARGDRTQIKRRMPAGHDDDVRPRGHQCLVNGTHVRPAEAAGIESTARLRRREYPMAVAVGEADVPLERPIETDALLIGHRRRGVQDGRVDIAPMLTHTFRLDDWRDAFTTLARQDETGAIKVAFDYR